jgi:gas vesicle protein
MTNEEIQLYSDIVKVGFPVAGTLLGGVIGALSTLLIAKLNHGNENKKEAIKRKYDLVLQAANDITEFEHLIGTYTTALSNTIKGLPGAASIDLEAAKREIVNRNQPLRRARMTLKILGLTGPEEKLEQYIVTTREVVAYGPNLSADRISELAKIITKGPTEFYKALAPELSTGT